MRPGAELGAAGRAATVADEHGVTALAPGAMAVRRAARVGPPPPWRGAGMVAALAVALLLAACAPSARLPGADEAVDAPPAAFPQADYAQAAARGEAVLRVEPAQSLILVEVRRGGSLGHLGHDHVVASHDVHGYVLPDAGRADLHFRLDRLVVDEPALRAEAGIEGQPSAAAVAGTRANMLEKTLAPARHPHVLIRAERAPDDGAGPQLALALTLNGVTRSLTVPVRLERRADGLEVAGRTVLRQTDFGLQPFAVLGGALRVEDALAIRFRIRAGAMR